MTKDRSYATSKMSRKLYSNNIGSAKKETGKEVLSILTFSFAVFILVALVTYSPADPSLFNATQARVQNACGKVGAYLASFFLEFFGIAAFLMPAAFIFLSTSIYQREGKIRLLGTLSGVLVAVFAMTIFLTLQTKYWNYAGNTLLTGGAIGVWFSEVLVKEFNPTGSSIISALVFVLAIALSTPVSVARFAGRVFFYLKLFFTQVVYRTLKIVVTYAAFLLGIGAMKTAQATARGVESAALALVERARNARLAYEENKAKKQALMESLRLEEQAQAQTQIEGLEDEDAADLDSHLDSDNKQNTGELSSEDTVEPFGEPEIEMQATGITTSTYPEGPSLSFEGGRPAILPHEADSSQLNAMGISLTDSSSNKIKSKTKPKTQKTNWKLPSTDFLVKPPKIESQIDKDQLYENANILKQKFLDFEIDGEVTAVRPGPVITLYEFKPAAGIKVSRIASLADDISMALSAQSVRIIAPLPGKSVVGIEIPSDTRENVYMKEFLSHADFQAQKHQLPVAMGKDIAGNPYLSDLARMPHLLCAGQTGSGKSVFMNGMICSLLYRFTPEELRLILVDPKMIEFSSYQDIPHLLLPVVDDSSQASSALKWAVREMERRYRIMAMMNVRNIHALNERIDEIGTELFQETLQEMENQHENFERLSGGDWAECFEKDEDGTPQFSKLPYIVIVIDELADLMMTAKKEVEISIARIAQKARASGIHLVIATQRPSTDVITGIIKANLPSRVSFQLASGVDSKTILDRVGAERLLGRGDMFFIPPGTSQLLRLHGAYLSDDEINRITHFLRAQGKPVYRNEILMDEEEEMDQDSDELEDPMFEKALELVKNSGSASASFLQRHLRIGYNRAARMIETMEMRGMVSPADGARPRDVLIR